MQGCGGADNSKPQIIQMPFLLGLRIHYANVGEQIYLFYYILLGFILKKLFAFSMIVYIPTGGKGPKMASLEFKRIIAI